MKIADLTQTEGIVQVSINKFDRIVAGYPINLSNGIWVVVHIAECVRAKSDIYSHLKREARMYIRKLTASGAYSSARDNFASVYVLTNGLVEVETMRIEGHMRSSTKQRGLNWSEEQLLQRYNDLVRSGRDTCFQRSRHFAGADERLALMKVRADEIYRTMGFEGWFNPNNRDLLQELRRLRQQIAEEKSNE